MPKFHINIDGDFLGYISWNVSINDDSIHCDADPDYIFRIANELQQSLNAIHHKHLNSEKIIAKA